MAESFVGEIRIFAGNFAPRAWAFCDGQLINVSQNDALFSLFGTIYGGDGRSTFGLPDLRGRIPIHQGNGPGLTPRRLGSKSGQETHTLTAMEVPPHSHNVMASSSNANSKSPAGTVLGAEGLQMYVNSTVTSNDLMNTASIVPTGGSQSHPNMMPYMCVNYIVSLYGTYPSRT
ncbi:MAG: tail fiber protein [Pseudomonadota bacterium]